MAIPGRAIAAGLQAVEAAAPSLPTSVGRNLTHRFSDTGLTVTMPSSHHSGAWARLGPARHEQWMQQIAELNRLYPQIAQRTGSIEMVDTLAEARRAYLPRTDDAVERMMGWNSSRSGSGMFLRADVIEETVGRMAEVRAAGRPLKPWMVGFDEENLLRSVTEHEFGHSVQTAMAADVDRTLQPWFDLVDKHFGKGRGNQMSQTIGSRLNSQYGAKNMDESLAELFSYSRQVPDDPLSVDYNAFLTKVGLRGEGQISTSTAAAAAPAPYSVRPRPARPPTPDQSLMMQPRHSSARLGLPVRAKNR